MITADGFDEAFIGCAQSRSGMIAVYDRDACIAILMNRDGMSMDEAEECFAYNTESAWVGENTPLFLSRCSLSSVSG